MKPQTIGALAGLLFGLAVLHYGFVTAVFLLACAFAGWWIARVIQGEVQLGEVLDRLRGDNRV